MLESTNILELQRNSDIMACDANMLVDLRDVEIDTSLPVHKRMEQFLRQVGNPYLFRVDGIVVKASFLPQMGRSLSDILPGLLIP